MKTLYSIVLSAGLFAALASAQPTITQVSNAASFSLSPLPNSSIAEGSFFAIFGANLGPATPALWSPYPLPTTLGDTDTHIDVTVGNGFSSTTVSPYLYFTYSGQINAVMPSGTPAGAGSISPDTGTCTNGCLVVTANGQQSTAIPITVVPNSFGSFSINSAGNGPSIITDTNYAVNTLLHTAKPGDFAIAWGTGLGPAPDVTDEATEPPCPQGCDLRGPNLAVTVWVGGQSATVTYAGRAPGYTALDQIVFTVPQGLQGCYVPVAVQVGPPTGTQVIGNFTTMSIDPAGGDCADATVKASDVASALASKGSANIGVVGLFSDYAAVTSAAGSPVNVDSDFVSGLFATFTTGELEESVGVVQAPSANTCTVIPFLGEYLGASDPVLSVVTYLNGGPELAIKNPSGGSASVPQVTGGSTYAATVGGVPLSQIFQGGAGTPTFFLNNSEFSSSSFALSGWPGAVLTGNYTVTGGGSAIGGFSQTLSVPAAVTWTNPGVAANPIATTEDLNITWTGGDPNGYVEITGVGSTAASFSAVQPTTPGALFECIVPTSAGSFNVPPYVLQSLPPTSAGLLLVGGTGAPVPISPTPSGLDAAYIYYRFLGGTSVSWQ